MTEAHQTLSPETSGDLRPIVAGRPLKLAPWLFGICLFGSAAGLFAALDANRREIVAPVTRPVSTDLGGIGTRIPELNLPSAFTYTDEIQDMAPVEPVWRNQPSYAARSVRPDDYDFRPPSDSPMSPAGAFAPSYAAIKAPDPTAAVVFDAGKSATMAALSPEAAPNSDTSRNAERVKADRLANPSDTVVQGSIIQAVLETALDSTQSGMARAIVSRDIRGFDGQRVLVPRGSRLVGEYESDLSSGQNRALVMWTRLVRPDGVTIRLQSPAADELGRAGIKGKVNTHFFDRFGGAILQSALDLGVGLATRSIAGDTVVIGLPGSSTTVPQVNPKGSEIRPTLSVKQGASVSVFVARDLDFSAVNRQP